MVVQIGADARQVDQRRELERGQRRRRSDARQHEQLRRAEGAERDEGLAPRPNDPLDAALKDFGADRAPSVEQQPQRASVRLDAEIGPLAQMRPEIGARGAAAFAVDLGDLIEAQPLVARAVEIVVERELRLARRGEEALLERIVGARIGDVERPAAAVERFGEDLVVFRLEEVRHCFGVGPAGIAERRPAVVVGGMAAGVDHRVDRRGAAERPPARLVTAPAAEAGLRDRLIGPIVEFGRRHQHAGDRRVDYPAVAGAAGFDQGDGRARVLAQPARQHAAGRTAAENEIIDLVHRPLPEGDSLHGNDCRG